ncbi:hypothetical protein H0Z60_07345 [Ectothiorhodospiraceae bacterium WFHF3C12]|nr:hypothetical protein [Ectothiorhodospiraceae bacterium WFHF3C12]
MDFSTPGKAIRPFIAAALALAFLQPITASLDGKGNDILTGIGDTAELVGSGNFVVVKGHVTCDNDTETVRIKMRIKQPSNGAMTAGTDHARCAGETQEWTVIAPTAAEDQFDTGTAEVWARARTYDGGNMTDEHEWTETGVELVTR